MASQAAPFDAMDSRLFEGQAALVAIFNHGDRLKRGLTSTGCISKDLHAVIENHTGNWSIQGRRKASQGAQAMASAGVRARMESGG